MSVVHMHLGCKCWTVIEDSRSLSQTKPASLYSVSMAHKTAVHWEGREAHRYNASLETWQGESRPSTGWWPLLWRGTAKTPGKT